MVLSAELDRASGVPLWLQIRQQVLVVIDKRHLGAGNGLPSENEAQDLFRVVDTKWEDRPFGLVQERFGHPHVALIRAFSVRCALASVRGVLEDGHAVLLTPDPLARLRPLGDQVVAAPRDNVESPR